ncbi:uncharacterized protein TrAFT101_007874 [Trichoderma asperellum]|uniref:uncharacterized protein n=1 Tax=Trichoderma asperellum TaxID=101201 RepID=UPI00331DFB98|nr:hypothetical protein TrAFT101_007874 [Trichoderma asperellum]
MAGVTFEQMPRVFASISRVYFALLLDERRVYLVTDSIMEKINFEQEADRDEKATKTFSQILRYDCAYIHKEYRDLSVKGVLNGGSD